MTKFNKTKTAENLMKSFAGESQARMRYTYYSNQAKNEKFIQIANIFNETADNEMAHAKRFFDLMNNNIPFSNVDINANYPVAFGTTLENLKLAAMGEHEEYTELYPKFAEEAEAEGYSEIAKVFREVAEAEQKHEKRFTKLAENMEKGILFIRDEDVEWKCNNCGYIHVGKEAPDLCPACNHAQGYFEIFKETY